MDSKSTCDIVSYNKDQIQLILNILNQTSFQGIKQIQALVTES
jgi:hypothetical protein